nr:hypothetical protein CFP56_13430 [Quercus suber]
MLQPVWLEKSVVVAAMCLLLCRYPIEMMLGSTYSLLGSLWTLNTARVQLDTGFMGNLVAPLFSLAFTILVSLVLKSATAHRTPALAPHMRHFKSVEDLRHCRLYSENTFQVSHRSRYATGHSQILHSPLQACYMMVTELRRRLDD